MSDHDKIRKLRELRGIKQETMAKALGISLRAYSKIESGETALTTGRLQQIARVLGIEPDEIIAFSEQNIFRSCQRCPYHQLPPITDLSFFTERLLYQQRIKELEQRVADLSTDIR